MRHSIGAVAVATLCAVAGSAQAGMAAASMSPGELGIESLVLDDGTWDAGEDWGYENDSMWLRETWSDAAPVDFAIGIDITAEPGETLIEFTKVVENNTEFDWTDFHIDLTPRPGGMILDVEADPNDEFGSVAVLDNGDGTFSINWDNFTGGDGVPIGGSTELNFSIVISQALAFNMVQTPTPAPGAAALLCVAGLVATRRRR